MITDLRIDEARKRLYYEKGYWQTKTLIDVWNEGLESHRDNIYVKDGGGRFLTYGETDLRASKLATWLERRGVRNGDIVSFQVPKWVEFAVIYLACLKVGAVMHPVDANLYGKPLLALLDRVAPVVFITPTEFKGMSCSERCGAIDGISSIRSILLIDRESKAAFDGAELLSDTLVAEQPFEKAAESRSDEVACILATSGSTGSPKMVLHTHNTILFSERAYLSVLDLRPQDCMWMPSPLNHATGFYHGLIAAFLLGSSVALQQEYSPCKALDFVRSKGCTWSHGATPFIYDLLKLLEERNVRDYPLRLYLCGGAPVPQWLISRAYEKGILLCESYGSTESCPHVVVPPEKCLEWNGRWSGIPYEGIEVRVVDRSRKAVPSGIQGEEASRGPHQFVGYLNEPARTDAALDADGWFYSGDLCIEDDEGRIRITGRIKDVIIRGGENISSNEVDSFLNGCPGIGEHVSIGMPDERLGERICTFVVLSQGGLPSLDEVKAYLASNHVPKRVWPERLEPIDSLPYTATGKVRKHVLAAELKKRMEEGRGMMT